MEIEFLGFPFAWYVLFERKILVLDPMGLVGILTEWCFACCVGWYIGLLMDKATGVSDKPSVQRKRGEELRQHLVRSKSVALIKVSHEDAFVSYGRSRRGSNVITACIKWL